MTGLSSSWGLMLDLGDDLSPDTIQALNNYVWSLPELEGPEQKMGSFQGSFRAAEGKLKLANQSAKIYTKFEHDTLGYPPGWQVPLTMHISIYALQTALADNATASDFLLQLASDLLSLIDYRMAIIGDLGMYYCNADMVTLDWLNLHQEGVLSLILSQSHPLTRQLSGQAFGTQHSLFSQQQLKAFWTDEDAQARYLRFKQKIALSLHTETLSLEWEQAPEN